MLKGTLDDFTLPDVFRLLSQSRKTGRLDVQRSAGHGNVYFKDGTVYFAESNLSRELVGQKLVRGKVLTDAQLMSALDEQAEAGGLLGEVLRASGLVTEEQLVGALRSQIEDAVFDLLRWELGEFDWVMDETVDPEISLSVSVENLIMEGSRRLDELAIINRKIPSETSVVAMAPAPPEGAAEINITPNEWRVLVLVNGQRTVLDIAEAVGADIFATMRTLYGLSAAGLIHVPGHVVEDDDEPLPELPSHDAFEAHEAMPEAVVDQPMTEAPVAEASITEAQASEAQAPEGPAPEAETSFDTMTSSFAESTELASNEVEVSTNGYHGTAYDPNLTFDEPAQDQLQDEGIATAEAHEAPMPSAETEAEVPEVEGPMPTNEWFDAPAAEVASDPAGEEVGEHDPFASEVLAPLEEAVEAAHVDAPVDGAEPSAEDLEESFQPAPETDIPASPVGYTVSDSVVDKRAAVQELSDLFRQSEADSTTPTFMIPDDEPGDDKPDDVEFGEFSEPETKHRVEDDEEITRGLISRLIDGVKGL